MKFQAICFRALSSVSTLVSRSHSLGTLDMVSLRLAAAMLCQFWFFAGEMSMGSLFVV